MDNKNATTDSGNKSEFLNPDGPFVGALVILMMLVFGVGMLYLAELFWIAIRALFSSESMFDKDPIIQLLATMIIATISYAFHWLKRKNKKFFGALEILFAIFLCIMAMKHTLGKGKLDDASLNIIIVVRICAFGSALFCFVKGFENMSKTNK